MAAAGCQDTAPALDDPLGLLTELELGRNVEPHIGEIVKKIKTLIEEKRVNDGELKKLQAHRGTMEKELDELNQEIFQLEGNCNTKEGEGKLAENRSTDWRTVNMHLTYFTERRMSLSTCQLQSLFQQSSFPANLKRLRFQYEQSQAQTERKAFEQQLEELIGKHKWMAEFYTPARLELEMRNIENSKQQLLTEEHVMTEKLSTLDKELDSLQQQGAASDEVIFLHSKEAKLTHQLFEDENKAAKEMLREASECHLDLQQNPKLSRFQKEWESRRNIVVQRRDNDMDESEDGVCQEGCSKQVRVHV
ncbi:synaptonemal complex central element protein 1-like [Carcharodon carcharias]|uniref:synaptonemal complex central element protein 1-like n=1 Tax=Carcharodon carcharias TaxID=13397 RepID=UPI001B7DBAA4|nr:synaptonemal complex central element protein 1-like [Carcharodon carcharias]